MNRIGFLHSGAGGIGLKRSALLVFGVVITLLGACAEKQSPDDVVRSFMAALETFDLDTAEDLVCSVQKPRVRDSLEPFGNVAQLDEAFDMTFEDLSFQEQSNDGDVAIIRVSGRVRLSFLGKNEVQDVNEEHVVVNEDGRWVICDP